jgi:hypothetical protein
MHKFYLHDKELRLELNISNPKIAFEWAKRHIASNFIKLKETYFKGHEYHE